MRHDTGIKELPTGRFLATCTCGWATKAPVATAEAAVRLGRNHAADKRAVGR